MPRLSVIIPVYNAEAFLEKCARSVLGQTFRDLELILVDDGSIDKTPEICNHLAAEDSRVRVIHQENAGVSAARNAGMNLASGDYIAFADADDRLHPEAYGRMFAALDSSGAQCCTSGYYLAWPDNSEAAQPPPMPKGTHGADEVMRGLVLPLLDDRVSAGLILGTVWRYLFRRSVIMDNGIRFSGAYLEDEIFLIEYFAASGDSLSVLDDPLYYYLQNPLSVTRRYLSGYTDTFMSSLALKAALVEKYGIPAPGHWRDNTCWGGLLIAVSNEFAPGSPKSFGERLNAVKRICRIPAFDHAIKHYTPEGMGRNKAVVAALIRKRRYLPLALLYSLKNRNRG